MLWVAASYTQVISEAAVAQNGSNLDQSVTPIIVVLRGDSRDGEMRQPLQRLATISVSDMDALWEDIGIDTKKWSAGNEPHGFAYPFLYAIQNYIVFEQEFHYQEVPYLLEECERAQSDVHSESARRALAVIMQVAQRENTLGRGLSFRPGLVPSSETSVVPL